MNLLLLYLLVVLILFGISVSSSIDIQVQVNLEENNNNNQNPNRTPIKPSPELPAHLIDESYNHVRLHPHHLAEAELYTPPNVHPLLPLDEIRGDRNVMEEFDEMWLTQEGKTVTHAEIDSAIEAGAIEIDHQNNTLKTPAFTMEIPQLYQMYCKRFHKFYTNQHLAKRISHFKENLLKIVRHNAVAPDDDARLGQTRTLDMGDEEFKETHAGSIVPAELRSRWGAAAREHHRAEREGSELNEIIIPPPKEEQTPAPSPPVSDTDTSPTVAKRNSQRNTDISPVSQCNTVGGYCTTNQKCVSTNGTPITGKCFSKDPNVKCCIPRLLTPVTFLDDFDAPRPHVPFPSIYTSSGPYKNWVEEGVVNPIRNQEDCGACYSFAAIAALESHYAIVTGKLYEFSEQQAVDCSKKFGNLGCIGGWYGQVFDYIIAKENKDNHCHGVSVRKFYPYANKVGTCHERRAIQHDSPAYITGYEYLPGKNITAIMKALDQAPLTSALYSLCPEFRFYTSGIIQDLTEECTGQQVDHAVNIVGYGTENDIDYWLIRNSWDQTFGLDGYAKIERGRDVLGIESHIAVLNIDFDA